MSSSRLRARLRAHVVVRWTMRVGLSLLTVGAAYAGYVVVRHEHPVTLPAATGRYQVGRVLYTWTDSGRTDSLSPHRPAGHRRLSVWVWFPAARGSRGGEAPYLPAAWNGLHLTAPVGWAETAFDKVHVQTLAHARVAAGRFPLVVLLPGLGFAAPQYTSLAVGLASHGYVVAGVTPTYSANLTVLDGRTVHASRLGDPSDFTGDHTPESTRIAARLMQVWADDALFAARRIRHDPGVRGRFGGHLDRAEVAYVGHSFGGTSALEACREDARCAAAVDIDGAEFGPVVTRGLPVPVLLLGHQGSCTTALCDPVTSSDRADLSVARGLVSHSRGHAWSVNIDGTEHFDFTDYAAYYLALPLRRLLPLGSIDGQRALHITGDYLTRFLAGSLDGTATGTLTAPRRYPEAHLRSW